MKQNYLNVSPVMVITVISLFLIIISPNMLGQGMFMDGTFYAVISLNLAEGWGDFWHLHFTPTYMLDFHEHPPLAFWLQSLFFRIFGDSLLIERFYSLLTYFISGGLLVVLWKNLVSPEKSNLYWVPVLLWASIPLNHWSVRANMLENTMMVFTLISVILILNGKQKNCPSLLFLAGFSIFLAALTKGFVALFPLSLPFFMIFTNGLKFKQFAWIELIILLGTILPIVSIFLFIPEGKESLLAYFNKQVIGSLQNVVTVDSRFHIVWNAFTELIPALIIGILFFTFNRKKIDKSQYFSDLPNANLMLLLALSGIIPIMISLKQRSFYIIPAFPFLATAIALYIVNFTRISHAYIHKKLIEKPSLVAIPMLLLVLSIVLNLSNIDKINYDESTTKDSWKIIDKIPENTIISADESLFSYWSLRAYLYRNGKISYVTDGDKLEYHLVQKQVEFTDSTYELIESSLDNYSLYKKKN